MFANLPACQAAFSKKKVTFGKFRSENVLSLRKCFLHCESAFFQVFPTESARHDDQNRAGGRPADRRNHEKVETRQARFTFVAKLLLVMFLLFKYIYTKKAYL